MRSLPLAPDSCSLDAEGGRAQAARYAAIGAGAELVANGPRSFAVRLAGSIDPADVDELIAVERECCPFFEIAWDPGERRLTFAVSRDEEGPALDAIAYALGLAEARRPVSPSA